MEPTPEQSTILDAARGSGNLQVIALAGCGKTSTLELIHAVVRESPILFLAFNTRIKEEMEKRMERKLREGVKLPPMTIKTFNGIGHSIWGKTQAGRLALNKTKVKDILREKIGERKKAEQGEAWQEFQAVATAAGMAKSVGYVPDGIYPSAKRLATRDDLDAALDEPLSDLAWELLDDVLAKSISAAYAGSIDFNDQIYMPALFGGTFPRFPLVLVDEAQDLSPSNHAMLDKLVRGRLIAVGDPWQSIYAFRGAKQGGMATQREQFGMSELLLSVSFRCRERIVRNVHWRVPHFRWANEGGHVETLKDLRATDLPDTATILCRNNAPLFRLALNLLQSGRSVRVAGSDVGPKIVGIMRKLGPDSLTRAQVISAIGDWEAERVARGSSTARDIAECMRTFAERDVSLSGAIAYAEHLFRQDGSIQLMTGHKSKGLEWDQVWHLDSWLIGESEQEMNLRYVISTRAREALYEIDSARITYA